MVSYAALLVVASAVVAEAPEAKVPDQVIEQFRYFVGEWDGTGTVASPEMKGEWKAKYVYELPPGEHCLTWRSSWQAPEFSGKAFALSGWDCAKKQIVETIYATTGHSLTHFYTIKSSSMWEGQTTSVDFEGKVVKARITLQKKGPKEFIWRSIGIDDPSSVVELHFRKVK